MTGSACSGCSVPLHNRVGSFAEDPYLAAGFAINFLTFVAAVALAGYSFWQLRPKAFGGVAGRRFFGVRVALICFVLNLLFQWIYMAVPNAMSVERGYLIFSLVPVLFQLAAETILVYSFTRTALQPLVQVRGFRKARGVALGLTIVFALVAAANWITDAIVLGVEINMDTSYYSSIEEGSFAAAGILQLTYNVLSFVWGLSFMGMAIHALRKSRGVLENQFRAVPKFMIGASVVWIIRSAAIAVVNVFFAAYVAEGGAFVYVDLGPIISAIVVNVMLLAILVLFCLAFRPHLAPLFLDGDLAQPLEESYKHQQPYQQEQTYDAQDAYHHQQVNSAEATRPRSNGAGIEVAQNYV